MRAAWASEVFMDGLVFSDRCLFDDQLWGRRFIARTEVTRKRRATLMACRLSVSGRCNIIESLSGNEKDLRFHSN